MSTNYQESKDVPTSVLCSRLMKLSDAVTKGPESINREFYMNIPAEVDHDADIVLSEAANRLNDLQREVYQLRRKVKDAETM